MKKISKKKNNKKIDLNISDRDYFGMILEDINEKFDIISEGQIVIENKVDALDAKVSSLEDKVDNLDTRVGSLENKVESLDVKVSSLEDKVDNLDTRVGSLENKVDALDTKISSLDDKFENFKLETNDNFRLAFNHFSNLEDELIDIREELNDVKNNNSEKISVKEFLGLKNRLFKTEEKIKKLARLIEQKV